MSAINDIPRVHQALNPMPANLLGASAASNASPVPTWGSYVAFTTVAGTSCTASVFTSSSTAGPATPSGQQTNVVTGPTVLYSQFPASMGSDAIIAAAQELATRRLLDQLVTQLNGPPLPLSGTFAVTNGSPSVSTSVSQVGTVNVGDQLAFGAQQNTPYVVAALNASTITLSANYTGTTAAAITASDLGKAGALTWPASFAQRAPGS